MATSSPTLGLPHCLVNLVLSSGRGRLLSIDLYLSQGDVSKGLLALFNQRGDSVHTRCLGVSTVSHPHNWDPADPFLMATGVDVASPASLAGS